VKGHDVILRGKVRNYLERDEAERIAWAAPGVSSVDNQLDIEWFSGLDDKFSI
jgi:osmotically-inducible protein OsmY